MKQLYLKTGMALAMLLSVGSASAYDFQAGGVYYNILSAQDKTAEVTRGDSDYFDGSMKIPATVDYDGATYSVTAIGDSALCNSIYMSAIDLPSSITSIGSHAFDGCFRLNEISFPADVTTIGSYAFNGCKKLKTVTLPKGLTQVSDSLFSNCQNLIVAVLPAGLKSIGTGAFAACPALSDAEIPAGVTSIGASAFAGCEKLTSVSIPAGITEIARGTFSGCSVLNEVTIPSSVKTIATLAFAECRALPSITLPDGLEVIGDSVFEQCVKLKTITLPNTVTSLGKAAFTGCEILASVQLSEGLKVIKEATFDKSGLTSVVIPNSVTDIEASAFNICTNLTNVTFSNNLQSIGNSAFFNCTKLQWIVAPASLKTIGNDAFYNCSQLTSVQLPDALESLGKYAFYGCYSLKSIEIPETITELNDAMFWNCSALTSVKLPATLKKIGAGVFYSCRNLASIEIPEGVTSIGGSALSSCAKLTEVKIPESVTTLGNYMFEGCTNLTKADLPEHITAIGENMFRDCSALKTIVMPSGATSIGNRAFQRCRALESVTIGANMKEIGIYAFSQCKAVRSFTIAAVTPPTLLSTTGESLDGLDQPACTLYVPEESIDAYKSATEWKLFGQILPMAKPATPPTAHAYQMGSTNQKWGFVSFPVNDLDALVIDKATSSTDDQIGAGECVNGRYYTYTLEYDLDFGDGLEPSEFVVWNAADYSKISSKSATTGRVVDMTYDYTTNTMYALLEQKKTSNGAIGLTALCVVDLATGKLTRVGLPGDITAVNGNGSTVEEHLVALASDPVDGTLYAMGEYRQLYTIDRMTGAATPVGSRNRVAITNDFQSMAFAADGTLYQAQAHPDYEYFMQIDTTTGALINPVTGEAVTVDASFKNNAARFPYDPQLTGLWFDGKKYNTACPAAVTGLTAAVAPGKDPNKINLSWVLPTANADGTAATVTAVKVYRFGTAAPLATLDATATAYTDEAAPNGDVSYYITAECADGPGFPAWTTVLAGADKLKAPANVKATLDDSQVTVSWDAPTATVNGGYADYDNITYNVTVIMGSESETVAENISQTTCTVTLTQPGTYTFEVTPVSCNVAGTPAKSNSITIVTIEQLPYATGFEDNDGGTLWTAVNNGATNYGWSIISGYAYQQFSGKFAQFKTGGSATIPANDWFISPAINCPAGKYKLTYYACGGSYDNHTYEVYMGPDSTDPVDFTDKVYSCVDQKIYDDATSHHFVPVEIEFELAQGGNSRIAFHGIGAATFATLRIDSLKLAADNNSGLSTVEGDAAIIYNAVTKTVCCPGASAITAYDLSGRVIAQATESIALEAYTGVVIVKATTSTDILTRKIHLR